VKVFLVQAFYIPSDSMYPTLKKNDRVLVNKLSYRLHDPNRGDIVVFDRPEGATSSDISELIKRIVGLPGEEVVIEGDNVFVDGRQLEEGYLPVGTETSTTASPYKCTRVDPCVVPDDHLWVMGDNRGDSQDSRWFGPIPEDSVVGRAFVVVWPIGRFDIL
ncbi:MAG TPA: signal peptidase I, partial [Acidimicrobiales bacterium]